LENKFSYGAGNMREKGLKFQTENNLSYVAGNMREKGLIGKPINLIRKPNGQAAFGTIRKSRRAFPNTGGETRIVLKITERSHTCGRAIIGRASRPRLEKLKIRKIKRSRGYENDGRMI